MKKRLLLGSILLIFILGGIVVIWRHTPPPKSVNSTKSGTTQSAKTTITTKPADTFDKTKYSVTDPTSPWVVINKQHPLSPINYAPADLTAVGSGQYMRAEAATALHDMFASAATVGYTVTPASGYRSYATQVSVYNAEIKNYGQSAADSESARPGYSEHQTGWAVDLASGGCSITDCFGNTPGGKWVTANAYRYGFILRYTPADTATTGYRAEAWHFRYVGTPLATELHDKNIATLEQFFGVTGGPNYK